MSDATATGPVEGCDGLEQDDPDDALEAVPRSARSRGWGPGWPDCQTGRLVDRVGPGRGAAQRAPGDRTTRRLAVRADDQPRLSSPVGSVLGLRLPVDPREPHREQPLLGAGRRPQLTGEPDGSLSRHRHARLDAQALDGARVPVGRDVLQPQGRDALRVHGDAGRRGHAGRRARRARPRRSRRRSRRPLVHPRRRSRHPGTRCRRVTTSAGGARPGATTAGWKRTVPTSAPSSSA